MEYVWIDAIELGFFQAKSDKNSDMKSREKVR